MPVSHAQSDGIPDICREKIRGGQEKDKTKDAGLASAARRLEQDKRRGGQEDDTKRRTRKGQEEDKRRTRGGEEKTDKRTSAARGQFRGAASECAQLLFSQDTTQTVNCLGNNSKPLLSTIYSSSL